MTDIDPNSPKAKRARELAYSVIRARISSDLPGAAISAEFNDANRESDQDPELRALFVLALTDYAGHALRGWRKCTARHDPESPNAAGADALLDYLKANLDRDGWEI